MSEPLNIVLVEPEIPQNTGNIARTCACTGARLHLVEPMGFRLTAKQLARAGCDYWDEVDLVRWPCAFLVFGRESRGLGLGIIEAHAGRCVRIPMREGLRSLNLSNAVAVATYEALRQQGYYGLGDSAGA